MSQVKQHYDVSAFSIQQEYVGSLLVDIVCEPSDLVFTLSIECCNITSLPVLHVNTILKHKRIGVHKKHN